MTFVLSCEKPDNSIKASTESRLSELDNVNPSNNPQLSSEAEVE